MSMRYLRIFFVSGIFLLTNCASHQEMSEAQKTQLESQTQAFQESNFPLSLEIERGRVKFVNFDIDLEDGSYELLCTPGNDRLSFYVENKSAQMFVSQSYFQTPGITQKCELQDTDQKRVLLSINALDYPYKKEKLNVDKSKVFYSPKDLKRIIAEKEIKKAIYESAIDRPLFKGAFKKPLDTYITSQYGNQRLFNNKKKSQHLGTDFRARTPIPIKSAHRGKVVFAGNLFFTGNVVVIDHGAQVYSMYGHLSKIKVKKGQIVEQHQVLGLSGATGRVSGPHLHWGVKVQGHWVDGFSLVSESQRYLENHNGDHQSHSSVVKKN